MASVATYEINGSTLNVVFGKIEDSRTEAVVTSDDHQLSMGGGTSRAVANRAGSMIRSAVLARRGEAGPGGVVVTDSYLLGKQGVKHVFHAVTRRFHDGASVHDERSQYQIVSEATRRCLELLTALELTSISLPALGTGFANFDAETSAVAMAQTIREFLDANPRQVFIELRLLASGDENTAAGIAAFVNRFTAQAQLSTLIERTHAVVLIHGIRTRAEWREAVSNRMEVEDPRLSLRPLAYGRFGLPSMLFPPTRRGPVNRVSRDLNRLVADDRFEQVSVIAHSFGTYAVGMALAENPRLQIYRLIIVGSVLPKTFPSLVNRTQFRSEDTPVVNEHSFSDVTVRFLGWLPKRLGFGTPGRDGFGDPILIKDCEHGIGHSGYFKARHRFPERWARILSTGQIPGESPVVSD